MGRGKSGSQARSPSTRPPARRAAWLVVLPVVGIIGYAAFRWSSPASPDTLTIPFSEAEPVVAAMRRDLPAGLAGKTDAEIGATWRAWTAARDAEIRARLARGDEDSVVHLWLFGTSFTGRPRATEAAFASLGRDGSLALLQARLDDLIAGIQSPGANDRLMMARQVLERAGIDVTSPEGQLAVRRHLEALRIRQATELSEFTRETARARQAGDENASLDAYMAYYRARGLSSDTSLLAIYSVERALESAVAAGLAGSGSVRRVAIVGPGLDFVDKAEGLDFYPQQTLQPFALVDSLVRTGLAPPGRVSVTTFDISPRVITHLANAARRVEQGEAYVVHLPLEPDTVTHAWDPAVVSYWQRFGSWIGTEILPQPLPPSLDTTRVRAIQVRPELVTSVLSRDLNIVVERLGPGSDAVFDLIVATNILVYYEPFEQALALVNVSAMLRPGGLFLTNTLQDRLPVPTLSAPMPVDVVFDRRGGGDTLYWFRRVSNER